MTITHRSRCRPALYVTLAAILAIFSLGANQAAAECPANIEIIDSTGDGAGNGLGRPKGLALDSVGNVYVAGGNSDNAFKITPGGVITQIIDPTGDGVGNTLQDPEAIAVDSVGNVYVAGVTSNNAFKITPGGVITQIIDSMGDGVNTLNAPQGIAVDSVGNVYVTGSGTDNAFKITPGGVITQIIDSTGDGGGNGLTQPWAIAVDAAGNAYVTGQASHNAFKITPGGVITQIIDSTGDGMGNTLSLPRGITVGANVFFGTTSVFVTGLFSSNAFEIRDGMIQEIIDATGDGAGHTLTGAWGIFTPPVQEQSGFPFMDAFLVGSNSNNAFKVTVDVQSGNVFSISEIISAAGDHAGNPLNSPEAIVSYIVNPTTSQSTPYVAGTASRNVFKITPDEDADGAGNDCDVCPGTSEGLPTDPVGRPLRDCNGDCLFDADDIQCIVDELLNQ